MTTLTAAGARARTVPAWIRLPIIAVALALPVYWLITDSGAWAIFADLQARLLDGEYYIVLNGALTFLVTVIPAAIVVQLLAVLWRGKRDADAAPPT